MDDSKIIRKKSIDEVIRVIDLGVSSEHLREILLNLYLIGENNGLRKIMGMKEKELKFDL